MTTPYPCNWVNQVCRKEPPLQARPWVRQGLALFSGHWPVPTCPGHQLLGSQRHMISVSCDSPSRPLALTSLPPAASSVLPSTAQGRPRGLWLPTPLQEGWQEACTAVYPTSRFPCHCTALMFLLRSWGAYRLGGIFHFLTAGAVLDTGLGKQGDHSFHTYSAI